MKFFINYQLINLTLAILLQSFPTNAKIINSIDSSSYVVQGYVLSSDTETGISGVNILVKGTNRGTISDLLGHFTLAVEAGEILRLSSVGYRIKEVNLDGRTTLRIVLEPSLTFLDEQVIIGYGEKERKDITGSITDIKSRDIEKSNAFNIEQAMQGQMPGVYVSGFSGGLNDQPRIFIRGMNTWGVTEPLYVIDGVPIAQYGKGVEKTNPQGRDWGLPDHQGGYVSLMNMINPADIASISVLKDASAAAIYGMRASNGVILIETRKGTSDKPQFRFNVSNGFTFKPNLPEVLNVAEYIALITEQYKNVDKLNSLPNEFRPDRAEYLGDMHTVNWLDELYRDQAQRMDVNFSASGKTEDADYFVALGYGRREGAVKHDHLDRYTLSTNVHSRMKQWLEVGLTYRGSYAQGLDVKGDTWYGTGSPANNASYIAPWQPIYNDGPDEWKGFDAPYDTAYVPSFSKIPRYGEETTSANMLALNHPDIHENTFRVIRNLGNAYLAITPFKGFVIKGRIAADFAQTRQANWKSIHATMFTWKPEDPREIGDGDSQGTIMIKSLNNYNIVADFSLIYSKLSGSHALDLLFNFTDQQYGFESNLSASAQTTSAARPYRYHFVNSAYANASSESYKTALQGYLGRISYNFKDKYYLDFSLRYDGSSRFSPENRWGMFPAAGLAWRMSKEIFMSNFSWLSDFKIRAGWGQVGNQEVRASAHIPTVSETPAYRYGSANGDALGFFGYGAYVPVFANPDLSWETTETLNVAIDGVLSSKVNFTVEYFNKLTKDLLESPDIPNYVGFQVNPYFNVGRVRNHGFDAELGYSDRIGSLQFSWNANFSTIRNEVVETYDHNTYFMFEGQGGGNLIISEGYPLYYQQGYLAGGIFQNQEEVEKYQDVIEERIADEQSPGDLWFKDINRTLPVVNALPANEPDSVLDIHDQVMLNKPLPMYYYGLSGQLNWKGFDLYLLFNGVGDLKKVNGWRLTGTTMAYTINQFAEVDERWTEEYPSTTMHRAALSDPAKNNRISDWYVEDAGYFRLTNWQLGYDLNYLLRRSASDIKMLRIYVGGNNAFVLTKWSGVDPDSDMQTTDGFEMRIPTNGRSLIFGLEMTF